MNRRTIGLIWAGGLVLMLLLYAIGPQHFLASVEAFFADFWSVLDRLVGILAHEALDAVRAAALALYAVFVVLAILAHRHGVRSAGTLLLLSVLFLVLIRTDWYDPGTKWFAAAVVAGVGAAMMTSRLLRPPPPRSDDPRWSRSSFFRDRVG